MTRLTIGSNTTLLTDPNPKRRLITEFNTPEKEEKVWEGERVREREWRVGGCAWGGGEEGLCVCDRERECE